MPLPINDTKWPPEGQSQTYHDYRVASAWYGGDMQVLANLYASYVSNPFDSRSLFWARQISAERRTMVHVPFASDVAGVSAAWLFGEKPKFTISDAEDSNDSEAVATLDRLNTIIERGQICNTLTEAADTASGMGGVYLKINWDTSVADYPLLSIAQPDAAVPEFKHGILVACTFWTVLSDDGQTTYRLLERHESGYMLTGLYVGTPDNLGNQIDLKTRADTADIEPVIATGIPGLLCRYIPNVRPNRKHRGSNLGRPDTAGGEALMDSLDEVYTSWMRDIRLAKGRIIVPEWMLDWDDANGATFNADREAFVGLTGAISGEDATTKQEITLSQFAIRAEDHKNTAIDLIEKLSNIAGYSPQSFGINIEGNAQSGTALKIREGKSIKTTASKSGYWKPALDDLMELILIVDKQHLGQTHTIYRPSSEMQDGITTDLTELATSVEMINRAQAASVETKIRMIHPDWTIDQVENEVQAILDEQGLAVPSPDITGVA